MPAVYEVYANRVALYPVPSLVPGTYVRADHPWRSGRKPQYGQGLVETPDVFLIGATKVPQGGVTGTGIPAPTQAYNPMPSQQITYSVPRVPTAGDPFSR